MPPIVVKDVRDLDPALKHIDKLPKEAHKAFLAALQKSILLMEREVVERTPSGVGNSPTGHLRDAIFSEIRMTPTELQGVVHTPSGHAPFVEFDTKPHWVPRGALLDWVHFKLGVPGNPDSPGYELASAEFFVRMKIRAHGTKGKHMFRKGYAATESNYRGWMLQALREAPKKAYK